MKTREIELKAHGKINLSLDVTGKRGNMHTLDSVVCCVDVYDLVRIRFNDGGTDDIAFIPEDARIPEKNTVRAAMDRLRETLPALGAKIRIKKGIPLAGGLGGSSADAAAVVYAATVLLPDFFDGDTVCGSVRVGSDVPALALGGCVRIRGIGEIAERIAAPELHIVTACGAGGVSSGEAYGLYDELGICERPVSDDLVAALKSGELARIAACLSNALTVPAIKLSPDVAVTLDLIRGSGALAAFMTGSGNCCCGLYATESEARLAEKELAKKSVWAKYTPTLGYNFTGTRI